MSATHQTPRVSEPSCRGGRSARLAATAAVGLVLAACASDDAFVQQPTVRSSAQTAPADLQLLCASRAATDLGADSGQVLPVSSAIVQPGVFRVDLQVSGQPATCTIDSEGNVLSVVTT